jgi:hypothetical protein
VSSTEFSDTQATRAEDVAQSGQDFVASRRPVSTDDLDELAHEL